MKSLLNYSIFYMRIGYSDKRKKKNKKKKNKYK